MVRLTRKVFTDLAIWMAGLGVFVGLVFPFFATLLGVPSDLVTWWFVEACMSAGFIVGAANIGIARAVVGRRLALLADRMQFVEANLLAAPTEEDLERCPPEACHIEVDSEDEIGQSAQAFNSMVKALASSRRTEAAVRSFNEMLASQLELDTLTHEALRQLLRHTGASAGAILVEAEGEMKVSAAHGIRSPATLVASDHVRRAFRTKSRQDVVIPADVAVEGVLVDFRPREVLVDPISYKQIPLGAIVLASAQGFSDDVRARLDLFRQGLSLALNNALVHDRLQRLAALDPLTAIYNRRFGMARLHEEFGRAVRGGTPLGVLLFDIDHFKRVNDTYGHLVGDRILVQMVRVARSVMREGDVMVRYGGEEFLAILPAASRQDLHQIGERLRRIVEDAAITDGDQTIKVTVSVGGAAFPQLDVSGEEELVKRADETMYSAKQAGRNRVVVA
ncbi:MAG: GGDEF domain-containing protein [Acidobacteria bacterium]|nr:GGDEF domain-containing protein [Acidobacteriota bacterium]